MTTKSWIFSFLCLSASTSSFSETFVKEKTKKGKKVSLARCQERAVGPLATEIICAHDLATKAHELVRLGSEIANLGHELAEKSLALQGDALEATADLLDEERESGRFAGVTSGKLREMCGEFEHVAHILARSRDTLNANNNELKGFVQKLRTNVATILEELSSNSTNN